MGETVGDADGHADVDHHQPRVFQLLCGLVQGGQIGFHWLVGDGEDLFQVGDVFAVVLSRRSRGVLLVLSVFGGEVAQWRVKDASGNGPSVANLHLRFDLGSSCVKGGHRDASSVKPVALFPDVGHHTGIARQTVDIDIVGQLLSRV